MNIKRRIERLESNQDPSDPEPLEVVVNRVIVKPGRRGPVEIGRRILSFFRNGKLVRRWVEDGDGKQP
jgi:hypothetical protein